MIDLNKYFTKYGSPANSMDERINLYFTKADHVQNMRELKNEDKRATETIQTLKTYTEVLEAYRKTLQERATVLLSAQPKMHLSFKREKSWYDKTVTYKIRLQQVFDKALNIRPTDLIKEDYSGKERHKAFKRFEELKKIYYGAMLEVDIEKSQWEK